LHVVNRYMYFKSQLDLSFYRFNKEGNALCVPRVASRLMAEVPDGNELG